MEKRERATAQSGNIEEDRIAAFEEWQKENYPKACYKVRGLKW